MQQILHVDTLCAHTEPSGLPYMRIFYSFHAQYSTNCGRQGIFDVITHTFLSCGCRFGFKIGEQEERSNREQEV